MRPFNFAAGPSTLPEEVLQQITNDLLDWNGCGMSVMEMSHRSGHFESILSDALSDFTELLAVPDTHQVLFMQGGGIGANAIIPLNLLRGYTRADYVVTGAWSKRSFEEARKYCHPRLAASAKVANGHVHVPSASTWNSDDDAAYLHLCVNETIDGVEFPSVPSAGSVAIVGDVSSNILSRPMDISRYGVLYAGAQKNIGIAGLTVYVVRKDLLDRALPICPSAFEWQSVAANGSMFNTPPTFAIYVAGLVFKWLKHRGGLHAIEKTNIEKSTLLYQAIDASSFYINHVAREFRSRMNIPFHLADPTRNESFLKGAEARGLLHLKGHRLNGGMRASLYNALPIEAVIALTNYMREFEREHS